MLEFYLNEDLGWSEAEYENLDEVFLEDVQEGRGTVELLSVQVTPK